MPEAKLKVILLEHTPNPENVVAMAAKLCYSQSDVEGLRGKILAKDQKDFVEKLVSIGHMSPVEHISFTFGIEGISRACSHQLVRHRVASYSQQSQRYVKETEFDYVIPPTVKNDKKLTASFNKYMKQAQKAYDEIMKGLAEQGITGETAQQDARFLLPNAAETKIVVTMNARELLHFFRVRCCNRAQWEIRAMATEMLREVKNVAPVIFKGAGPGCLNGQMPGRQDELRKTKRGQEEVFQEQNIMPAFTIAVAGKGGTGKTTLTGLLIRYLTEKRKGPVLAVDADANSNLNEVLGVHCEGTVGELREEALETVGSRPHGMSLDEYLDMRIAQVMTEAKGFDLLVMGRPEGPGCYCAANNVIRKYTDHLLDSYPYIVTDNEAGLEHLSRRTTQDTDLLLIISEPSVRGILTAGRVNGIVDELGLKVGKRAFIVNRVNGNGLPAELEETVEKQGLSLAGTVPVDDLITQYDMQGTPLAKLP